MTTHALATDKGCKLAQKAKGHRLQREDFPSTPAGWTQFCDYRIRMSVRHIGRAQRNLDYWKKVREGEHMAAAVVKIDELALALAEAAKLKAELEALKAAQKKA